MSFIAILILFVAGIVLAVLWHKRSGGYMPEPYRSRPCQGFAWRRVFPSSSDDEIRGFLRLFAQAFAYRDAQMLQVGPEDRVIDLYRAEHPQTGGIDGLELETLAAKTEKKYKIDFNAIWGESLTFGALFAACQGTGVARGAGQSHTRRASLAPPSPNDR
jgi:propanediol dehydratase small subunit